MTKSLDVAVLIWYKFPAINNARVVGVSFTSDAAGLGTIANGDDSVRDEDTLVAHFLGSAEREPDEQG